MRKSNFRDAKNLAQSHITLSGSTSTVESKTVAVYHVPCPASLECPNSISCLANPQVPYSSLCLHGEWTFAVTDGPARICHKGRLTRQKDSRAIVLGTCRLACMIPTSSQTSSNCLRPGKWISNGGFGEPGPLPMLLLPFEVWGLELGKLTLWRFTGKLKYCLQEPQHPPGKSEAQTCNCFSGKKSISLRSDVRLQLVLGSWPVQALMREVQGVSGNALGHCW